MKSRSLLLALMLVTAAACQKSELSDKPAAEVTETSASTSTMAATDTTASQPAGVIRLPLLAKV